MRNDLFSLREEESLNVEKDAINAVKDSIHEPAMELVAAKRIENNPVNMNATQDFSNNNLSQTNSLSHEQEKVRVRTLQAPNQVPKQMPPAEDFNRPMNQPNVGESASIPYQNNYDIFGQNKQSGSSTITVLILLAVVVLIALVSFVSFTILNGLGF